MLGAEPVTYVVELKIDGVAMSLTYENGLLTVKGPPAEDGEQGDDVTHNLQAMPGVPLRLDTDAPPSCSRARGEVYLTQADLIRINRQREADGEPPYANCPQPDRRLAQAARPEGVGQAKRNCSPTPAGRWTG
ncbi:MAG: hypothetical protein U0871_06255 [Gemmataceae bacterium]